MNTDCSSLEGFEGFELASDRRSKAMAQHYSDPKRESDAYALPNVETFKVDARGYVDGAPFALPHEPGDVAEGLAEPGWYYWFCFPGCMPDSEPMGPFESEREALDDARDGLDDEEA